MIKRTEEEKDPQSARCNVFLVKCVARNAIGREVEMAWGAEDRFRNKV